MLNKEFKKIINNLEQNIPNQSDLIYAKSQVTELGMMYLDELQKIENYYKEKLDMCEKRITNLEQNVQRIDNEMFQVFEEDDDANLEPIKCPYCNVNFFIGFDSSRKEIKCPVCNNVIELDWGNFEDDM